MTGSPVSWLEPARKWNFHWSPLKSTQRCIRQVLETFQSKANGTWSWPIMSKQCKGLLLFYCALLLVKIIFIKLAETFTCFWNLKILYRVHYSWSLVPVTTHINPVHKLAIWFFKTRLNIIGPFRFRKSTSENLSVDLPLGLSVRRHVPLSVVISVELCIIKMIRLVLNKMYLVYLQKDLHITLVAHASTKWSAPFSSQ